MSTSEQKQTTTKKSKPPGIFSILFFLVIRLMMFTLLAWIILTVWFTSEIFLKSKDVALYDIQEIIDMNVNIISYSKSSLAKKLIKAYEKNRNSICNIIGSLNVKEEMNSILVFLLTISEIVVIRLLIFILMLPVILLIVFVCLIDGLVKRDIRKFQGARESTLLFHKSKGLITAGFYAPIFMYLCVPLSVSPLLFLSSLAILLGFSMAVTVTYFKKYV